MKKVTFANQKGGVGKTATSCHLAWYAAKRGLRTIFIDLDGQRTGSRNLLGADVTSGYVLASDLFFEKPLADKIVAATDDHKKQIDNLWVIPGDKGLDEIAENADVGDLQLGVHLERLSASFDICIIDPPPTLGKQLRAALSASDYVVMPFIPVRESTDGLGELLSTIDKVRDTANPRLAYLGFLATKVNHRSATQKRNLEAVKEQVGPLLLDFDISERAPIADSLAQSVPVWVGKNGESHRKAAKEVQATCKDILNRMGF